MPEFPDQLILPTFSARLLGRLVVWVGKPDVEIADPDWETYVKWLHSVQQANRDIKILTVAGGRAPSARQRGMLNRELDTERMRVAIMLSNPNLVAIVRVTSWFIRGVAAFKQDELSAALKHLRETDVDGVRSAIRNLGGEVASSSR